MPKKPPIPTEAKKSAQRTYEFFEQLNELVENPEDTFLTPRHLIQLGSLVWPHTYEGNDDDLAAFSTLRCSIEEGSIDKATELDLLLRVPNEQCTVLWSARWVDQGCPRLVFDSNYASLLMATDVGKEMLDNIVFPWKAFLIQMPDNLLSSKDDKGNEHPITQVFVQILKDQYDTPVLNIVATTKNNMQIWRHGVPLNLLTTSKAKKSSWGYGLECDSRDERVLVLIGRLIISMCMALSDPDNYRKKTCKKQRKKYGKRLSQKFKRPDLPEVQTFVIGKPTKINCRDAIVEYAEGKTNRNSPTLRFLVRGHWRWQPYGPGKKMRKRIPIEPYWKGPDGAKILTRTILMEDE